MFAPLLAGIALVAPAQAPVPGPVASVRAASAAVTAGGRLGVTARLRRPARVTFWLSRDARLGAGDVRLGARRGRRSVRAALVVPARAAPGRRRLLACAGGRCRAARGAITVTSAATGGPPQIGGCEVFPASSPWNRDVSAAPADPRSATYVAQAGGRNVHLDLGTTEAFYGIPYTVVPRDQPLLPLRFGTDGIDYSDESDPGPYPIPADAPIEGGSPAEPDPREGDRHVLVLRRGDCTLFETYNTERVRDGSGRVTAFRASSAATWDLTTDDRRPARWTSADAAGLPILPGLLRYEEAASGEIRHALRFTLPRARRAYLPPASHCGPHDDADLPAYGSRWRLRASFDESPYSGPALAVVRALKRYGLMFADQGSAMYITGTSDPRWAPVLDQLHGRHPIPGDAFEVVAPAGLLTTC